MLYFVLGFDSCGAIDSWYRGENILKNFLNTFKTWVDKIIRALKKYLISCKTYNAEIHILYASKLTVHHLTYVHYVEWGDQLQSLVAKCLRGYMTQKWIIQRLED